MLRKFYLFVKKIPLLGSLAVLLRNFWHQSFLKKLHLFYQDRKKVIDLAQKLFPEQPELVKEIKAKARPWLVFSSYSYGHAGDFDVLMLYLITRAIKPKIVLETGVASGRSSAFILEAIRANGCGQLYSIDLPQYYSQNKPETYITSEGNRELKGFVPAGHEPGWLVPKDLRLYWNLILGDSKVELPKILSEIGQVDVFYHDSDHSYQSMLFEFDSAWPKLKDGGFILSDDIGWNNAWVDFVAKHPDCINYRYRNFGILKKNG